MRIGDQSHENTHQLENGFFKALLVSITWPISFIILAIVHVITVLKIVNNK